MAYRIRSDGPMGIMNTELSFARVDVTEPMASWGMAAASTQVAAIIVTDRSGKISEWNESAMSIFGYDESEMLGYSRDLLVEQVTWDDISLASIGHPGQLRCYRHKSGRRLFCTEKMTVLGKQAEGAERQVWFICDMTPVRERFLLLQKELAEERERRDEALRADKSKDVCIALISHELKQPLTMMLTRAERMLETASSMRFPQLTEDLHAMSGAIRRQARIVDDLLELSRARTGKLRLNAELVDMGELVGYLVSTAAATAPDRHISVTLAATRLHCWADPIRLEQIFSNLLDNAIKFGRRGGRIDVDVEASNGFARVSVADDGAGISSSFLPQVFTLFGQEYRASASRTEGLGIGLALAQELARVHGGRITARSEGDGRGAQFTVWLPLAGELLHVSPTKPADVDGHR